MLGAAGFLDRVPHVVANKGPLGGGQYVALEVRMHRRTVLLDLLLEYAGFSGEDAEPVRAVLCLLAELAEAAGRPAVRTVVDRLVVDRRRWHGGDRPWDGLVPLGLDTNRGLATGVFAGLALGIDAREGDRELGFSRP
jgi:hypothetical protein